MRSLRWRLVWIALFTVFAVIALVPRNTTQRVLDQKTGRMKDTTVRRVPINLGLDRALRAAGVQAPGKAPVSAVSQLFGADTAKQKQSAKRKQQPDTAGLN